MFARRDLRIAARSWGKTPQAIAGAARPVPKHSDEKYEDLRRSCDLADHV
jgi:hypothetical protein